MRAQRIYTSRANALYAHIQLWAHVCAAAPRVRADCRTILARLDRARIHRARPYSVPGYRAAAAQSSATTANVSHTLGRRSRGIAGPSPLPW